MALGRLLNRFGKDFEQIDAQLPDHLGKTIVGPAFTLLGSEHRRGLIIRTRCILWVFLPPS